MLEYQIQMTWVQDSAVLSSLDSYTPKEWEIALSTAPFMKGADGSIVTIGDNGNWFVDGVDTGRTSIGDSAYQVAVDNGFVGTEKEWLLSLVPVKGKDYFTAADKLEIVGSTMQVLQPKLDKKQDKLIAGKGIDIKENVISTNFEAGTKDYNDLNNKPQINGEELVGNKISKELHIPYTSPTSGTEVIVPTDIIADKAVNDGLGNNIVSTYNTKEEASKEHKTIQEQIDALVGRSDVVDVVASKAALDAYDINKITENDVIKVLKDESRNNEITYYRLVSGAWVFLGSLGDFYSKEESDDKFVAKELGKDLSTNDYTNKDKEKVQNTFPNVEIPIDIFEIRTASATKNDIIEVFGTLDNYKEICKKLGNNYVGVIRGDDPNFVVSGIIQGAVVRDTYILAVISYDGYSIVIEYDENEDSFNVDVDNAVFVKSEEGKDLISDTDLARIGSISTINQRIFIRPTNWVAQTGKNTLYQSEEFTNIRTRNKKVIRVGSFKAFKDEVAYPTTEWTMDYKTTPNGAVKTIIASESSEHLGGRILTFMDGTTLVAYLEIFDNSIDVSNMTQGAIYINNITYNGAFFKAIIPIQGLTTKHRVIPMIVANSEGAAYDVALTHYGFIRNGEVEFKCLRQALDDDIIEMAIVANLTDKTIDSFYIRQVTYSEYEIDILLALKADKSYVDDKIGNINTILDNINGEII